MYRICPLLTFVTKTNCTTSFVTIKNNLSFVNFCAATFLKILSSNMFGHVSVLEWIILTQI